MKSNYRMQCDNIVSDILNRFNVKLKTESRNNFRCVDLINSNGTCERMLFSDSSWKGLRDKLYIFRQGIDSYLHFNQKFTAKW